MTTKPQSTTEPELQPCRCGRKALIERFHDGDDPQPLFVATCGVCPVKTYDQFTAEEAARVWNEFVSATVNIPDGQWQHVQIKAGNPRVVAIQFETAEQATSFMNSFAATPASTASVVGEGMVSKLVDAVYRSMAQYDDQTWWLDELKAKARVRALLKVAPIAPIRSGTVEQLDGSVATFWPPAAPVEQSNETAALRDTNILCRSGEGRPKVEIWFKDLKAAQKVHKWLVSLAGNDEGAR